MKINPLLRHFLCLKTDCRILNIMKFASIIMFVCVFQLYATNSKAQNSIIELSSNTITVEKLFAEIEKQTDYLIVYNSGELNVKQQITFSKRKGKVSDLLDELVKDKKLKYENANNYIVFSKREENTSPRQVSKRKITGTVVDKDGVPIIGVTVMEKGETSRGTITDIDGRYTLDISGDELQFSYVGYLTQVVKVRKEVSSCNVVLEEDTKTLDEVVVIGYGTAKKKDLAGSVVRADLNTLKESPNISLASALQGTVPGLNVGAVTTAGADPSISIRGRNSISGTTAPLIVLDGIIFRGNLVDINTNDIESIDVLKDASAAAIYGSQASNGVILITSKSAKVVGKPKLEYNGSYSVQELSTNKMKPMNREDYLQFVADRFLEESRMGDDLSSLNPDWDVTNHLMDSHAVNGYLDGTDTNWWDTFTNNNPYIQSHDLSIRGKNTLSSYYMSLGYVDQNNVIINDTYKRYNIRINLDTKITDWLKVGTQSFFTLSDYSGASPSLANVIHLSPLVSLTDDDGEQITYPYLSIYNPMKEIENDDLQKRYNIMANFYLDLNVPFVKGLNYRMNFSQNLITAKTFTFRRKDENELANGSKTNASQYDWTLDNILTYKRLFGKHDINMTFVYGVEKRQYESTGASGTNFTNTVLGYNYLQAAKSDQQYISSSAWEEASLYSMLRLGYTYNDRYIFTGTVRRDGFSGFGRNNKFAVFPSAAVAWRISEEDFIKGKVNWLDDLKLRLSYGVSGNRTVSRYQTLATLGFTDAYLYGDGASAEKGVHVLTMANNDLKWETTNTFNVGVDFSLLNNRLFGSIEYYKSSTHDLLYAVSLPNYNAVWSNTSNIGKLSNWGTEFSITGVPVKTKDFSWDVTFNFSLNRNKVVSITGIDADGDGKEDDLVSSNIFIDEPYGVIYDYKQTGMWQMEDHLAGRIPEGFTYGTYKVEDLDGDGKITAANDRQILGYTDPAYRFSIQNTFNYKNWELKVFVNSIQGGNKYYYGRPASALANPDYIYQYNSFSFDYWTPENPDARYRQIGTYPSVLGNAYSPLVQRNFVRLQDLTLAYTFPSKWMKKIGIDYLKLYVTGKNLFTITDWDGWDPESGTGLVETAYPLMRSYTFGINFSF